MTGWQKKLHASEARFLEWFILMISVKMSMINGDTATNSACPLSPPAIHHRHHVAGMKRIW